MSVGFATSKAEIDARAGEIARSFQAAFDNVATMQGFLARTVDQDLLSLGFTPDDIATLKTAFSDLSLLGRIWAGVEPLPEAKDFRVFVARLWGVGAY